MNDPKKPATFLTTIQWATALSDPAASAAMTTTQGSGPAFTPDRVEGSFPEEGPQRLDG